MPFKELKDKHQHFTKPDFQLFDEDGKDLPYISSVKCGNDEGNMITICIRLDEDPGLNSIVNWNLFGDSKLQLESGKKMNFEQSSY